MPLVLDIPSLCILAGKRVFLQGPSGSGKTTLLNLLGGVASPESGRIEILGQDLTGMSNARRDRFRADNIGFIFQLFNLVPYLSLIENITLPCRFSAMRRSRIQARGTTMDAEAHRLLEHMQLDSSALASRSVSELSVGQQQRVAAARALIGSPPLIIADEPTSAIDADARQAFLDLLFGELTQTGATLLFVSHETALGPLFDETLSLSAVNQAAIGTAL